MMQIAEFDLAADVSIGQLQVFARQGKLRIRAFGEDNFFGLDRIFGGNLDLAAKALPGMFDSGMLALYRDVDGLFLGPINPKLIEDGTFPDSSRDDDEERTSDRAPAKWGRPS